MFLMGCSSSDETSTLRQIRERIGWLTIHSDLEIQHRRAQRPAAHRRDTLTHDDEVSLFDRDGLRVAVGTEIGIAVFDDEQLAVTQQT